jgi:hypothetical protein
MLERSPQSHLVYQGGHGENECQRQAGHHEYVHGRSSFVEKLMLRGAGGELRTGENTGGFTRWQHRRRIHPTNLSGRGEAG